MPDISFSLPPDIKSFQVSGARHDGGFHAWVVLHPAPDIHGNQVWDVNAGCYEPNLTLQDAVDKAYAKAKRLLAEELVKRASLPAPKPPKAGVSSETQDLLSLLDL